MFWVLLVVGILHVVGIGWGLPASDGWDNDGVAPRDFLPGLAATYTPGRFYTYPPVHLALLAVVTLPIVAVAAIRAPSLALHDVVPEILKTQYMTPIAYVARSVSVVMSLAIVLFLARIAEEIRAYELGLPNQAEDLGRRRGPWTDERVRRVGWCTAAFVGTNASFTYYAHTTNLDVPYLFWATGALLFFTRALVRQQPHLLRRALVLAVLALGTKDQAYGIFLLSLPIAFVIWASRDPWGREHRGVVLKETAIAMGAAVLAFLLVDAVVLNPAGFLARVRFLTGSASQDFVEYMPGWRGSVRLVVDAGRMFNLQYPAVLGLLILVGIARTITSAAPRFKLAITLLPLLAALSFTLLFNFTARRSDARFLLPQALLLSVYGGIAIEAIAFASASRRLRMIGQGAVSIALALGVFVAISVDATLLGDPRYDAESWLAARVQPGDTIETYGLNVYMPRMPAHARVLRVGPEPVDKRNPMPGVEEVQAPFGEARGRGTRFIVVSTGWVWRYIDRWPELAPGRSRQPTALRSAVDKEATDFFDSLIAGDRGFKIAHESKYDDRLFPLIDVHGASGKTIWIYERVPD